MTRQVLPQRLLWVAVVLLLAGVCTPRRQAQAAPPACAPALTLQGDEDVVAPVAEALRRRGVQTQATPGCPTALVRVERAGDRAVAVTVVEIVNQDVRREFGSADLALSFIESWARRDISGPLLDAADEPARPARRPEAPTAARAGAAAFATVSVDSGGRLLVGGEALGCAVAGPVCIGGVLSARGQAAPGAQGPQITNLQTGDGPPNLLFVGGVGRRVDLAALLLAEVPLRVRAVVLAPALGLGVGWQRADLDYGQVPGGVEVLDSVDQAGLRARAAFDVSIPLRLGLAVDLGLVADFAFAASAVSVDTQCPFMSGGPGPSPCPERRTYRAAVPAPAWGTFGARAGVRWSGPR